MEKHFTLPRTGLVAPVELTCIVPASMHRVVLADRLTWAVISIRPATRCFRTLAPNAKLYFASDGHPGLGKLDVFVATRSGGVTRVENMGQPINSPADDFGLIYTEANKRLSWPRTGRGGKGDDDIYFFQEGPPTDTTTIAQTPPPANAPKMVRYFIAGTVSANETPIAPLDSARVRILDDATGQPIAEVTTGQPGTFGKYPLTGRERLHASGRTERLSDPPGAVYDAGKKHSAVFLTKPQTDTTFNVAIFCSTGRC